MTPARVELKLILDEAGISDFELEMFSQRFNIQKRIFLIQVMGCDLGYRYAWYIRGPYCRRLTAEAFTLKDELLAGGQDHEGFELTEETKRRVARAKRLWRLPDGLGIDQDDWLELLASIHYVRHIVYWPQGAPKEFEGVFRVQIESKPKYEDRKAAAREAWDRLDTFGLIENKSCA
jgi:hypothetical protein